MVDITSFKGCMSNFTTGITIITTLNQRSQKIGVTINSFNSVSLDPLLILFSLKKSSYCYDELSHARYFTVNILSTDQQELVQLFTKPGENKWQNLEFYSQETRTPSPAIKGCLAFLECEHFAAYEGGDHTIIVGKVMNLYNDPHTTQPLIYFKGTFKSLTD